SKHSRILVAKIVQAEDNRDIATLGQVDYRLSGQVAAVGHEHVRPEITEDLFEYAQKPLQLFRRPFTDNRRGGAKDGHRHRTLLRPEYAHDTMPNGSMLHLNGNPKIYEKLLEA